MLTTSHWSPAVFILTHTSPDFGDCRMMLFLLCRESLGVACPARLKRRGPQWAEKALVETPLLDALDRSWNRQ